jgi:hypothetical protein
MMFCVPNVVLSLINQKLNLFKLTEKTNKTETNFYVFIKLIIIMSGVDFLVYLVISGCALTGIYYMLHDGVIADEIIENRPDKDSFIKYLKTAPLKEKIHYVLWSSRYVRNKPLIKE